MAIILSLTHKCLQLFNHVSDLNELLLDIRFNRGQILILHKLIFLE